MIAVSAAAWTAGGMIVVGLLAITVVVCRTLIEPDFRDGLFALVAFLFAIAGLACFAWLIGAALTWAGVVA